MTQAARVFKPLRLSEGGSNARLGRLTCMPQSHDDAYNRDQDQKAGSPQRMAQEPAGAKGSARSAKTATDPASGESHGKRPAPNQAEADQTDGAPRRRA